MKSFFKYVLATITGIFILNILAFFVFLIIMGSLSSSNVYKLKDNTILYLNLSGVLKDKTEENPLMEYLGFKEADEIALSDVRNAIKKAKENDKIKGIYIEAGFLSSSYALLSELRDELEDFKKSGKFVVSYGDMYPQSSYFVSSVADKVVLNPQGNLDLHGIASVRSFYKGLLDKIGVEMQVFKVGTYKSAVEPYIQEKMSEPNKEQVSSYIGDIWKTIGEGVSKSRSLSLPELNAVTDSFPLFKNSHFLVERRLIDTLMYEVEVKQYLAGLVGEEKFSEVNIATIENMKSVNFIKKNNPDNRIAVLFAEGSIMSGKNSSDIQDKYYVKQLEKLKDDENVKAVVFRINSGGGSAYASEQIWKAVSDLKKVKPIVVSMGGAAASGGYYIACNATRIIAQPNTLTGSIGIFGMFPNVEGLTKKIGLSNDGVKTNKFSDFGDFSRPMREEEKEVLQQYINNGYDLFITRCAEGRGIPKDSIDKIGQGRVWSGIQALKIGLVDELGGIDRAIELAAGFAGIEEYSVREYPAKKSFWQQLMDNKKNDIAIWTLKEYIGDDYLILKDIKEIKNLKTQDFIQARIPYDFRIE